MTSPFHDDSQSARAFREGYDDGLRTARSMESRDVETLIVARGLAALGEHAVLAESQPHSPDNCFDCQTAIALTQVLDFGRRLRAHDPR